MLTHIGPLRNYNSSSFTLLGQEKKQHGLLTVYLLDSCDIWGFHIFSLPWGISDFIYFLCGFAAAEGICSLASWVSPLPLFFLFFSATLCIPSFRKICISLGVLESLFPMEKYNHIRQSFFCCFFVFLVFYFLILKSLILTCIPKHEPPSHLPDNLWNTGIISG